MSSNILIITNSSDLHADLIVSKLLEKGHNPFRINLDHFPRDYELVHQSNSQNWMAQIVHLPTGKTLKFDGIKSVWTRKPGDFSFLSDDQYSTQEKAYANLETEHVLNGLLYSLQCYWMNHPTAVRSALWKGEQTHRAVRMGFKVPASLITNHPEAAIQFKQNIDKEMVLKALSTPGLAMDKVAVDEQVVTQGLETTILTDDHFENIESVREIPCYFQEYIDKQFELRITVIGNRVFAAKIHSQQSEKTKVDVRDYSADILYEAFQLPEEIEQRCKDYVHSYNLQYGAIDIIVTPKGEYVFLENNPAGQFLFVEQLVPELEMIDALANCLIESTPC